MKDVYGGTIIVNLPGGSIRTGVVPSMIPKGSQVVRQITMACMRELQKNYADEKVTVVLDEPPSPYWSKLHKEEFWKYVREARHLFIFVRREGDGRWYIPQDIEECATQITVKTPDMSKVHVRNKLSQLSPGPDWWYD